MSRVARNVRWALAMATGAAATQAVRRAAFAPPGEALRERAHMVAHSGPWRHGYVTVNGLRMHYAEIGEGPLVILLHGFPQNWYTWHLVMPHLAERFHVIAPDMRGYNETDKPLGVESYRVGTVASDIVALIEALGEDRAHVIGHDWGGSVAWRLGTDAPHRVDRLGVINAPHMAAYAREARKSLQLLRSLYVYFFQLPVLPEATIRTVLKHSLRSTAAVPGSFSEGALDMYENGISQPGAATAMINYYRAAFRYAMEETRHAEKTITAPTLLIWGLRDFALTPRLAEGLEEWVPNIRVQRIEESGHWVPEEKPRLVSDLLMAFLS